MELTGNFNRVYILNTSYWTLPIFFLYFCDGPYANEILVRWQGPENCSSFEAEQLINSFCRKVCEHTYGVAPGLIINGHTHAVFPYISAPLEYILQELLKNAMR